MPFLLVSFDAMTSLMTKHQNCPEALSSLLQELRFSMNFAHQDTRSGLLSLEQPLHKLLPIFSGPVYWIFHKGTLASAGTI